jgi:hypothetical protein
VRLRRSHADLPRFHGHSLECPEFSKKDGTLVLVYLVNNSKTNTENVDLIFWIPKFSSSTNRTILIELIFYYNFPLNLGGYLAYLNAEVKDRGSATTHASSNGEAQPPRRMVGHGPSDGI